MDKKASFVVLMVFVVILIIYYAPANLGFMSTPPEDPYAWAEVEYMDNSSLNQSLVDSNSNYIIYEDESRLHHISRLINNSYLLANNKTNKSLVTKSAYSKRVHPDKYNQLSSLMNDTCKERPCNVYVEYKNQSFNVTLTKKDY